MAASARKCDRLWPSNLKIVEGADYSYPNSPRVEWLTLKIVRWRCRKRLREFIAPILADIGSGLDQQQW